MRAMKKSIAVLAILLPVFAACNSEPARQAPIRQRADALKLDHVMVPAIQGKPVYTGQVFHYHENLTVTATGTISLGAGITNVPPSGLGDLCGQNCPLPDGHRGALLAVVGEAADDTFACTFEVGGSHAGRPVCQGRLYLVVNDDSYRDNSGGFTVEFETFPLVRSSACRRACLAAQEESTEVCQDACEPIVDEVEAFACIRQCSLQASAGFTACMNDNCGGVPDQPADCGQVCSQTQQPALDSCIDECLPNTPENSCGHQMCVFACLDEFHDAVGDCIQGTCHGDRSLQDCALVSNNAYFSCMAAYFPDACPYSGECLGNMPGAAYRCATGVFLCINHHDCQ